MAEQVEKFQFTSAHLVGIDTEYTVGAFGVEGLLMAPAGLPGFYILTVVYDDGSTQDFFCSPSTVVIEAKRVMVDKEPDLVVARQGLVLPGKE